MDLITKYSTGGSTSSAGIISKLGKYFGITASVPSTIAFSAKAGWNEAQVAHNAVVKENAARGILSFGNDRIPVLHAAWAQVAELVKKNEQTKKNLALSGLPTGQYITEIQRIDLEVKTAENACQQAVSISFRELDSLFSKFNSSEDFKNTVRSVIGPFIKELEDDGKKLEAALTRNREVLAQATASRAALGF